MFCVLGSQGTVADFCSFCGRWPRKGLLRSSLSLLGLWRWASTDALGGATLWRPSSSWNSGHAGGCHSQVSLFLPTFLFQKPQFPHVDYGFGTRSDKRRKTEEEEGDCQTLTLFGSVSAWLIPAHSSDLESQMTVLFHRNTTDINSTYKPSLVVLAETALNQTQAVLCPRSSEFANEWLRGIHPVSDAFR